MITLKPEGCIYPDCLNCKFNDCQYDDLEDDDILASRLYDKEIIHERSKQNAIAKGKMDQFRYENSAKGKERAKRYWQSEKGKDVHRRYYRKMNCDKRKSEMRVIRNWLERHRKPHRYVLEENIIKVDRWKIKIVDNVYIIGRNKYETQKDVINQFLIPHYGCCYKEIKR